MARHSNRRAVFRTILDVPGVFADPLTRLALLTSPPKGRGDCQELYGTGYRGTSLRCEWRCRRPLFVETKPAAVRSQGGGFAAALQGTHLLMGWFSGNNLLGTCGELPTWERESPVTC